MSWQHSVRGVPNHWCSKDKPHHFPSQCKNAHPGLCFPPAYPLPVRLMAVGGRRYYVYRYEGKLNDGVEGIVLMAYPKALSASRKPSAQVFMPGPQQKHKGHLKCVPGALGCGGIHPPKQGEAGVWPVPAPFFPRAPAVLAAHSAFLLAIV